MLLLTTLLTPLALLASFNITDRLKAYMFLFLVLETGMLGVFLSLDLLIFFVFWEIGLVPMYFLINQWGSEKGEHAIWKGVKVQSRNYASLKFIIFTMGGSLGLLLAIQLLGVLFQNYDLPVLYQKWNSLTGGTLLGLPVETVKTVAFRAFVIAFAIQSRWPSIPGCRMRIPRPAHRRFDDPGGRHAETWCVWFPAAGDCRCIRWNQPIMRVGLAFWRSWQLSSERSWHMAKRISSGWWPTHRLIAWALCCWVLPQPPGGWHA